MKYVLPFHFVLEPMKRVVVISFKGNEEFDGFEPQLFDDDINGKGIRLVRYRKDKKIDVYYEPGVIPDQNLSLGAGINEMVKTTFKKSEFDVTETGLHLNLLFTDAQGRENELRIEENSSKKYPVPILAPIGSDVVKPDKMFFAYMKDIDFTYLKSTQIHCALGDCILETLSFPIIIHGNPTNMVRYCSEMKIVALNSDGKTPICFEGVPGKNMIDDQTEIICNTQGKVERIKLGEGGNDAELIFDEGLPNLLDLNEEQIITGSFEIDIYSQRVTQGQYELKKVENKVYVELYHFREWNPKKYPFAYRLLFTFVKMFKKWPTYFSWKGVVELNETVLMKGEWSNIADHKGRVI